MARLGSFSPLAKAKSWFDKLLSPEGWFNNDLIGDDAPAVPQTLKYWDGGAWVSKPLKRWNGTAWVDVTSLKRWNGSAWELV